MPIFSKTDKKGNRTLNLEMFDGIDGFPRSVPVCTKMLDTEGVLIIQRRFSKTTPASLKFSQIVAIEQVTETEIIEQSKSVAGRAITGGLLFGPLGAIIGGASGFVGKKRKRKVASYLVINYRAAKSEEIKVISLKIVVGTSLGVCEFINNLKIKAGLTSSTDPSRIEL